MRAHVVRLAMFPLALACKLVGQVRTVPAPGGPRFDVISIKVNNSGHIGGSWGNRCSSGRWSGKNVPVSTLVKTAFGLMQVQISGIPDWDSRPLHRFDITAICPQDAQPGQLDSMLQAMLADRFHFSGHFETRDIPVRTLEVAKTGIKLKPASGHCVPPSPGAPLPPDQHACGQFYGTSSWPDAVPGRSADGTLMISHYQAWSASLADFVAHFGRIGRFDLPPLVDETGLPGKYDFDFQISYILNEKDAGGNPVDQTYKFDQALEKQEGLILNQTKLTRAPMPVLVIDHVEMPTAN